MQANDSSRRIVSMDQYRGYAVAGMFVVNFLGNLNNIPKLFKHNNTFFSLADSIMPSFLFAVGFSYRLTMLRRIKTDGPSAAYHHAVVRSLALVLLSFVLFGFDVAFTSWSQVTLPNIAELLARFLKAKLWEVLAIIGVAQLLVLPVVAAPAAVRLLTIVLFMAIHVVLSWAFNYEFVYGRANWLDQYWGAAGTRAWDGGLFGTLMWSVPMLAGTLAYDVLASSDTKDSPSQSSGWGVNFAVDSLLADVMGLRVPRLIGSGVALMILGYLASCLSTLYDLPTLPNPDQASPVKPAIAEVRSRPLTSLLATPPFFEPPPPEVRKPNYWMMDNRVVTLSFTLFSTGFAIALYGLCVLACDVNGWQLNLFRMLGQNPLAAYVLHVPVAKAVGALVPKDSPLPWCLVGLALFFTITVLLVRYLDRHKIYVRL